MRLLFPLASLWFFSHTALGKGDVKLRARRFTRSKAQSSRRGLKETRREAGFELPEFYHTTDGIRDKLKALESTCPGFTLESVDGTGDNGAVTIDVVTIRKPTASPRNKMFLLFGEHARELISPESGLDFVRRLCGDVEDKNAQETLEHTEFRIVVNGNPNSRKRVELGETCLRVNENEVDLNRNWDVKFKPGEKKSENADIYPGESAFSEPETQIFKAQFDDYRPTTFLTIHSGTKGMYMPPAYTESDADNETFQGTPKGREMLDILENVDKDHCQCPFGGAGKEVGYECPGTCLDYAFLQGNAKYAFAFEIYTTLSSWADLKTRFETKMKEMEAKGRSFLLQRTSPAKRSKRRNLADREFQSIYRDHPSDFVQLKHQPQLLQVAMDLDSPCFDQFNPDDKDMYDKTVANWSKAYLDVANRVNEKEQ